MHDAQITPVWQSGGLIYQWGGTARKAWLPSQIWQSVDILGGTASGRGISRVRLADQISLPNSHREYKEWSTITRTTRVPAEWRILQGMQQNAPSWTLSSNYSLNWRDSGYLRCADHQDTVNDFEEKAVQGTESIPDVLEIFWRPIKFPWS